LAGIWKSDRSLSIAFAERNNKLLPKTRHFWAEMVGRLTVTVTGNSIRSELPPWDIKIEGTAHHMDGFSNTSSYKVVYSDPDGRSRRGEPGHFGARTNHLQLRCFRYILDLHGPRR
jgi:hypothetical protein